jgi:pimeloyl-ACP methyl ester carboxylesterase
MYFSWRDAIQSRQGIMTDQPPPALFKRRCLAYARFMDTVSSQDSIVAPGETRAPGVSRWIVTAAVASLVAGVLLAHVIEPGVGVEKVILAGNTPTIHIFPKTSEPHPVALLAHGVTASKETMFRFGEALAAAGFDCYAVDLAGHGESRLRCSGGEMVAQMRDITRALGRVDVFVGHSMGAGVGQASVQNGDLSPKLFIAAGANPSLGKRGPPLLLLAGDLEELVSLASLKARSDARLVLSPWSDHVLEIFDPRLVNAGVEAACAAVGITPPPAQRIWLWRLAGVICGMAGALGLIWSLPELDPRLARARGILVPGVLLLAVVLTTGRWFGASPHLHRMPLQISIGVVVWLVLTALARLGLPRWILAAAVAAFTLLCVIIPVVASGDGRTPFRLMALIGTLCTLFAGVGLVLGRRMASGESRRDGDLAVAIFLGYSIGQWMPKFF